METKQFLESVLGDEGYYCVFAHRIRDDRLVQKFFDNLDATIHAAHNLDAEGYDAYFALGTFEEAGSRKTPNVKQLKSFFLDLDCGPTKDYASQSDALDALRIFCKELKLPRPTVINSGRGIHVYWALTESVSCSAWVPVAEQFKRLCKTRGLRVDPAVPADAARVLRVPETHNHKPEVPTEVKMVGGAGTPIAFDAFVALLGDDTVVPKPPKKYEPVQQDAMMQALTGSFVSRFKTILIKTMAGTGCEQLKEVVNNQANVTEPLWRAGLSIAKFCIDGNKAIHKISVKHPEYSFEDTETKADLIKGPYLCSRFDEYRAGVCTECKHWEKIKSPISLGREAEEADESDNIVIEKPLDIAVATPIKYTIPKYPHPFFRGKSGGVFKHSKNEDNEDKDVLIYFNDLYVIRRIKDPEAGESLVMRLHLPKDGVREFTIPLTAVGTKDEFRKQLAMQGVAVLNVQELMEYVMKWVNQLQFSAEAEEACRQFGWKDDKHESFLVGNMDIYKDRIEVSSPSTATVGLFPIFKTKGTLDNWKQIMEFYNQPGMEVHQFMFGLSLGAVLMEFQPINAAAFHVWSKGSGLGKTTAMYAGASIWGDPDLMVMQERDTFNSKMNRAEVYKNLPCYMDEMTNTKPQDLSDWAYQLPSGLQRNRMGPKGNVERARGKPWKTLFGTTGNTDILERIALYKALPQAEAQRVLSCRVEPIRFATKAETDVFSAGIKDNFGHAGVVYIQYILNNLEAVKELAASVQRKLDAASNLSAANRYWSALASRPIAGLMLAKKAGLINWQIAPIVQWIIGVMKQAKIMISEMDIDAEYQLTDYLAENYNNMLRIKSTDDSRGTAGSLDKTIIPDGSPRGHFVARYEYDVKKLYLIPKPLKEWCGKQQINYAGFVESLKNGRTKAVKTKVRLGKGTHINLPPTDVLVLDCSGFMNDETEQNLATTAALFQKQNEV
jgi:hypothetical protein